MQQEQFERERALLNERCEKLLLHKGADYTLSGDRLDNFKRVADLVGVTPLQVWAVYFAKHLFSILNFVKGRKLQSEEIGGRFEDARNYVDLGWGLVLDTKEAGHERRAEVAPVPAGDDAA